MGADKAPRKKTLRTRGVGHLPRNWRPAIQWERSPTNYTQGNRP